MGSWGDFLNEFAVGINRTLPGAIARSGERRERSREREEERDWRAKERETDRIAREVAETEKERRELELKEGPKGAARIREIGERKYREEEEAPGVQALTDILFPGGLSASERDAFQKLPKHLQAPIMAEKGRLKKEADTLAKEEKESATIAEMARTILPPESAPPTGFEGLSPAGQKRFLDLAQRGRKSELDEAKALAAQEKAKGEQVRLQLAQEKAAREVDLSKTLPITESDRLVYGETFKKVTGRDMPQNMTVQQLERVKPRLDNEAKSVEKKMDIPNSLWEHAANAVLPKGEAGKRAPTSIESTQIMQRVQQYEKGVVAARELGKGEVDKPLTVEEATKLQVPFGTTRGQAMGMGKIPIPGSQMAKQQALKAIGASMDDLEKQAKEIFTASGPLSRVFQAPGNILGGVSQSDPRIVLYEARKKSMLASLARASGEVGVLTDKDIERIEGMLPRFYPVPDTQTVALGKMKQIRQFLKRASAGGDSTNYIYDPATRKLIQK